MHLQADNYAKFARLLPAEFMHTIDCKEFFIMSIFNGDQPHGVIYADRADSQRPMRSADYQLFKGLCLAINHYLQNS